MASDPFTPDAQVRYTRTPIRFSPLPDDETGVTSWGGPVNGIHPPSIEINQDVRNSPIVQTAIAHEIAHSMLQHPAETRNGHELHLTNSVSRSDILNHIPLMKFLTGMPMQNADQGMSSVISQIPDGEITPSLLFRYGYGLQNEPESTVNTFSKAAADAVGSSPNVSPMVKHILLQMYQNHLRPPVGY